MKEEFWVNLPNISGLGGTSNSPAENTKNEVHDEESSKYNHRNEVCELPCVAHGILDLRINQTSVKIGKISPLLMSYT